MLNKLWVEKEINKKSFAIQQLSFINRPETIVQMMYVSVAGKGYWNSNVRAQYAGHTFWMFEYLFKKNLKTKIVYLFFFYENEVIEKNS